MMAPNERLFVDCVVDDVYEEGRQEERAATVRYLEGLGLLVLAGQITRGEHLDGAHNGT